MNLNYPNGKKYKPKELPIDASLKKRKNGSYSNRGMTLEEDLNETNQYYRERKIAVIHKKPTPVQIVQVDYPNRSAAVIKEAYFKLASTTDYNGVYKGRYIDFEAKETQNPTSFPLKNFHQHQIEHMEEVMDQGAICFVILRFTKFEQVYLLEAQHLLNFWNRMMNGGRKSITKEEIEQKGYHIPLGFQPRIDYIKIIEQL
ncbi:recombination protein U [Neobacillus bataviensis]|uniref:Holliday junction resolvase RecU n=1 Tax=Neobacillus bataviensis TaxID=220685 RepID=A0A561DS19_9BACI|nr:MULTISPECIES: Holliday junction resolvase RecU [Bacillaceae]PFO02447.1 Holliday junction resolvase RecU [Bacillus sp. AFS076308]PGV55646.1 Holliday junction resolvase RecU [Bacillus sp. AFS037270]TWE06154.1 recombination protein U [Neobacillus bataviensis]